MLLFVSVSFAGYGAVLYAKYRIAPAVLPLVLFTGTILILFFGGVLNVLTETTYVLFGGGLLAFCRAVYLFFRDRSLFSGMLSPGVVFFAAGSIFFILMLQDEIFLHYDNFSHWGLIVKELFQSGSLPGESSIITYTTYPPGSALFAYYIVSFTGFSESMALIAQAILITGALTPLFLFCSWKQPVHAASALFIPAVLLLVNSSSIFSLLVDPLLGYIAAAAVITAFYYRNDWKMMGILLFPMLSALVLIKDSGKIFLAFTVIWVIGLLIRYLWKYGGGWKETIQASLWSIGWTILFPLVFNLLWSRYIAEAYETSEYEDSKFAITEETLTDIDKSPEFIDQLLPMVVNAGLDFSSPLVQGMVLADIAALLTVIIVKATAKRMPLALLYTALTANVFYVIYIALLYLMYLYLMPQVEAEYLAGFDRYQSSVVIFSTGIIMVFTIRALMEHAGRSLRSWSTAAAAVLAGVLVFVPYTGEIQAFFHQENSEAAPRKAASSLLTELRQEEPISPNTRITVINDLGDSDRGFLRHLMRYERMSASTFIHTQCSTEKHQEQLTKDIGRSGYLMVIQITSGMQECLEADNSIEVDEPGLYRIEDGTITSTIQTEDG
ncbi:hypothetical protein [Salibacterium halotolerans]|uniref:Dolichyl-phosphate-mannose-protein mannosyltransferase n=1 Tax=Salibacterium halotolerans TaxID=1884432 RepID=A0A1I5VB29_9BACI|nr:hypothetical protein [Salibacterium halotolerans]SFQ04695.1 hypothetical protein SAMN05518683_11598 [Salibacterium halotolerans]